MGNNPDWSRKDPKQQKSFRRDWLRRVFVVLLVILFGLGLTGCTPSYSPSKFYFHTEYEKPSSKEFRGQMKDGVYRNGYFNVQYVFADPRWKPHPVDCSAQYHKDYLRFKVMLIDDYRAIQPEDYLQDWVATTHPSAETSNLRTGTVTVKHRRLDSATCNLQTAAEQKKDQTEVWSVAFLPKEDYALCILSRSVELPAPYAEITKIQQTPLEHVQPLLGTWTGSSYQIDNLVCSPARSGYPNQQDLGVPVAWFDRDSRLEIQAGKLTAGQIKRQVSKWDRYNTNIQIRVKKYRLGAGKTIPVYRVSYETRKRVPRDGIWSNWSIFDETKTVYQYESVYVHKFDNHLILFVIPEKDADSVYQKYVTMLDSSSLLLETDAE